MVAGESGLGKSTLIDSLFLTDLYSDRAVPTAAERLGLYLYLYRYLYLTELLHLAKVGTWPWSEVPS